MKKILVVDDDHKILELLKYKLTRHGYDVITARNQKEFWDRALSEKFDLLILDIWLKNKIGTDIYHSLLDFGLDANIPVIFITALLEAQPPRHGGRYALYSKPFNFEVLLKDIESMISGESPYERHEVPVAGSQPTELSA